MIPKISLTEDMKYGFVPTLNRMGYMKEDLGPYSQDFIDFSVTSTLPVLDMGTAYGFTTLAALQQGARVIANDIDERHLAVLKDQVSPERLNQLQLAPGKIPGEVNFEASSVGGILASRVLNYLRGEEIMQALGCMYDWLSPGGKIFLITETPYKKMFEAFIPVYERRKKEGYEWPGEVEDVEFYASRERAAFLPQSLHLIEESILRKAVERKGFAVEMSSSFSKKRLPADACLDGYETAGLIAKKPSLG